MSEQNLAAQVRAALEAGEGILRLAPTWVPRSFLMPGGRLKLSREDLYALGTHRGGIDERWFASTTAAANEGAPPDEGLSYVVHDGGRFTLKDAIGRSRRRDDRRSMWNTYKRWPVYSKFFDNLGPIPHHMHQNQEQAAKLGREGQARELLLPAPAQLDRQQLPLHVLRPRARDDQGGHPPLPRALEPGRQRHPRSLQGLSPQARHRLAGSPLRLARPGLARDLRAAVGLRRLRHVPVDGRRPARSLGAAGQRRPRSSTTTTSTTWSNSSTGRRTSIPSSRRTTTSSRSSAPAASAEGYVDKWIVYGTVDGKQLFSACELTVEPGRSVTIKDPGAYGLIVVQGSGLIGKLAVDSPNFIRFGEVTQDEVFVTAKRAGEGVTFHNTGSEPFVSLRYFGPDTHADLPKVGDYLTV